MKNLMLKTSICLFLLSCLFPPWQQTFDRNGDAGGHGVKSVGHQFVLSPPQPPNGNYYGVKIDFGVLAIEWAGLAALGAMAFVPWPKLNPKAIKIVALVGALVIVTLIITFLISNQSPPTPSLKGFVVIGP